MIAEYFKAKMQKTFNEIDYIEYDVKNIQTFSKNIDFGLRLDINYLAECSRYFRLLPTHSQSIKCPDDEEIENNMADMINNEYLKDSSCYYNLIDYELGDDCDLSHCRKKRRIDNGSLDFNISIEKEYCDMV